MIRNLLILFLFLSSSLCISQDMSQFELRCHYPLSSDGVDKTNNYSDISLDTPVFSDGGILSRGCYALNMGFGDSCLIMTPVIAELEDSSFAIQVEFKVLEYNKPIFVLGRLGRFLGLQSEQTGELSILFNNSNTLVVEGSKMALNRWYQATLIYSRKDFMIQLFLDGEFVFSQKKFLHIRDDGAEVTNSNFARGRALNGYLRDLKVYSTNIGDSEDLTLLAPELEELVIWPNPTSDYININIPYQSYKIFDSKGGELVSALTQTTFIDVQSLAPGTYFLSLHDLEKEIRTIKFIKQN